MYLVTHLSFISAGKQDAHLFDTLEEAKEYVDWLFSLGIVRGNRIHSRVIDPTLDYDGYCSYSYEASKEQMCESLRIYQVEEIDLTINTAPVLMLAEESELLDALEEQHA